MAETMCGTRGRLISRTAEGCKLRLMNGATVREKVEKNGNCDVA